MVLPMEPSERAWQECSCTIERDIADWLHRNGKNEDTETVLSMGFRIRKKLSALRGLRLGEGMKYVPHAEKRDDWERPPRSKDPEIIVKMLGWRPIWGSSYCTSCQGRYNFWGALSNAHLGAFDGGALGYIRRVRRPRVCLPCFYTFLYHEDIELSFSPSDTSVNVIPALFKDPLRAQEWYYLLFGLPMTGYREGDIDNHYPRKVTRNSLAEAIAADAIGIRVTCACGHTVVMSWDDMLGYADPTTCFAAIKRRAVCKQCGGKKGLDVRPEY